MRLRSDIPIVPLPQAGARSSSNDFRAELSLQRSAGVHRIVHLIGSVHPKAGGPSTVVTRLAAAQAALGHDVTILSFLTEESRGAFEKGVADIPGFEQVRLILKPSATSTMWLAKGENRRELQRVVESADVVHLHGVWEPLLLLGARTAKRNRIPYVVRPCGMLDPWSLRQHAVKKRVALAAGYRWMLNNTACLHVLNADEKRLIDRLGLTCRKSVIPNGVFLEEIHPLPARGTFHGAHPELKDKPYVLFLSRLHHKKGLDYLLEAFCKVALKDRDVHLVVAGPDDGMGAEFSRKVLVSGFANRVHVVGPLYGEEKLAALADAALFCLPSRQEGFSLATSEALACGVPVVISEAVHFPEVAQAGAGRVVGLDAEAIAGAMLEILGSPVTRTAMGKAGRQLMESRFTWPVVAERCEAMYASAVGKRQARTDMTWRGVAKRMAMPMMQLGRFAYHLF